MRLSSSLLLLSLGLMSTSCGKWAKANSEHVQTMTRPQYPVIGDDVFALNSPKNRTTYKGTLFIANDKASPVDFAELINASVQSRESWAAMKSFEVESDYVRLYKDDVAVAPIQVNLMKEGLQAFQVEALSKSPIAYTKKMDNAVTWIDRELASLHLNSEQASNFEASWGEYCEAKIIELAAHPVLAQNLFKSQPSPTPLCQKYYAAHELLSGPSCTAETGDYLKCVWLEGVNKTRWFTSPLEASDPLLAAAKTDKRLRLANLLSDANYEATRGVFGSKESSFILTGLGIYKKNYFDKKDAFVNIALDQKNDTGCLKVIANAGSQDICRVFGLSPEERSPRQIIKAVEGTVANASAFLPLPAPAAPRTATTQQLLQYLNERNGFETSESDRLFFELKDGKLLPQPSYSSSGKEFTDRLPEFRGLLAAEFYGDLSPADLTEKDAKTKAIAYQEQQINAHREDWTRLSANIAASTDRGLSAANRPGFGHGFLQYTMTYQQFKNILSAQMSFVGHENYAFQACFDLETKTGVACPADLPLVADLALQEAKLTQASDGGKIEFSFTISPAVEVGLGPKPRADADRKPDFFMDLPVTETEGRTLRFELYRNRLDNHLDIMTGKAFIEEAGQRKYEAGISMWEQSE